MNIYDLVTNYVSLRRKMGQRFITHENILRSFCRAAGPRTPIIQIRPKAVTKFLTGTGTLTTTWHLKYRVLKGFFQFAVSRGHRDNIPLPAELPKCQSSFAPYIYSRDELRCLLGAVPSRRRYLSHIEPATLRTILLLLYGAGLRRGEVLRLKVADVDLANALLTIRDTKFFKSRLVPVGPDLSNVLSDYARWRITTHPSAKAEGHFFVSRRGTAIHRWNLQGAFERLREQVGVRRIDGGRHQPRLHDLRHAFAVHRLTEWYRLGADVQRLVYHLSVYMGHSHLTHTQVYLTMTPGLLRQAGTRFERYADMEDGHE
jgi:integrase/recombinase XerD